LCRGICKRKPLCCTKGTISLQSFCEISLLNLNDFPCQIRLRHPLHNHNAIWEPGNLHRITGYFAALQKITTIPHKSQRIYLPHWHAGLAGVCSSCPLGIFRGLFLRRDRSRRPRKVCALPCHFFFPREAEGERCAPAARPTPSLLRARSATHGLCSF
jgi:hypothetical protein